MSVAIKGKFKHMLILEFILDWRACLIAINVIDVRTFDMANMHNSDSSRSHVTSTQYVH